METAQHIRQKLAHLIGIGELVNAAGIAASHNAHKTPSGAYVPDSIFVNVGRRLAGENIFQEWEILCDIAGGIYATLPFEEDWYSEDTREYLEKYIMRNPRISAENQHRLLRLIGDLLCSGWSGVEMAAQYHGGGSPIMETIGILRDYDVKSKKDVVKYLAGISLDDPHG